MNTLNNNKLVPIVLVASVVLGPSLSFLINPTQAGAYVSALPGLMVAFLFKVPIMGVLSYFVSLGVLRMFSGLNRSQAREEVVKDNNAAVGILFGIVFAAVFVGMILLTSLP